MDYCPQRHEFEQWQDTLESGETKLKEKNTWAS